jgi:hypothetical protein
VFQFPVQIVQQDVGQQGRERPAFLQTIPRGLALALG